MNKNTFSPWFLKKVLILLLKNQDYRDKFFSVLSPEHFNHEDKILYYYAKAVWELNRLYEEFPSLEVLYEEVIVQKGKNINLWYNIPTKEQLQTYSDFLLEIIDTEVDNVRYIEDNTVKTLSALNVQKVLLQNKDSWMNGTLNIEEFVSDIVVASTIAKPVNLGVNLYDDLEHRTAIRENFAVTPGLIELNIPNFSSFLEEGGVPPGSLAFFLASSNGGKCLKNGTLVRMFDTSLKKVEDIQIGDKLLGPDSKVRNVLGITAGYDELFEIKQKRGISYICNADHLLTLVDCRKNNLIDISVKDYLKTTSYFKQNNKGIIPNYIMFKSIEEPKIDPYFLGLWFGDGTKDLNNVGITTSDDVIVNYLEEFSKKWGLNLACSRKPNNKAASYRLSNVSNFGKFNILLNELRLIVGPTKSVPDSIKFGSIETRQKFLAGFLDSDGYIHHNFFEITQKREDYIKDICFIAQSLGFRATYKPSVKSIKRINFTGTYFRAYILGDFRSIPIKIEYKKKASTEKFKDSKRTNFSVIPVGKGYFSGFSLDGDGRFLLEDFTITHNSNGLIQVGHDAAFRGHNVLYVTAELSEDMIKKRFDACLTGIPSQEIKSKARQVYDKITNSPNYINTASRIRIIEVPMGHTKPSEIDGAIQRLIKSGFRPNLLIVDYADNLQPEHRTELHRIGINSIYKDLRAMAQKHKLVVWTASQMNDGGTAAAEQANGVITMRHVNDDRGKIHLADLCIAIARTQAEKETNLARLVLLKNRLGSGDGTVIQIHTRFDISRLINHSKSIVNLDSLREDSPIEGLELDDLNAKKYIINEVKD